MQRTRTRFVTFRATDDELERLKFAGDRQGAACLSDLGRSKMLSNPMVNSKSSIDKSLDRNRRAFALEAPLSRLVNALGGPIVAAATSQKVKVSL
jgi:hypothetical protein